jgi:hypothetical protein
MAPERTPIVNKKIKPKHPCAQCGAPIPASRKFCSDECIVLAKGFCSYDSCTNSALRAGLCGGHIQQRDRADRLTPLRAMRSSEEILERDEQGRKLCTSCHAWRPPAEFGRQQDRAHLDGLQAHCRWCARGKELLKKFGITIERHQELLAAQGGGCAVCLEIPAKPYSMHVDHDHACCPDKVLTCGECVRGLLCHNCNLMLGHARDQVVILRQGIAYLLHHQEALAP